MRSAENSTVKLVKFFLFLSMLIGVGVLFAKVTTDYRHSADFAKYKTYSWLKVKAPDPLWNERITRAVDSQLTAKGWSRVDDGGDAAVSAVAATHNEQSLQTWYNNLGGGWYWGGFGDGMATTTTQNIPVGTLVIDIFDAQTKHLIWRGMASDTLSDKPEKNEKKLTSAVKDMFKDFPPKSKG
jgi:hypothetical protein